MKLVYKVQIDDNTVVDKCIPDIEFISVGTRSLSYRLRGKNKWLFSLRYCDIHHIRVFEDDCDD